MFLIAAVGIGLLVSSLVGTMQQAMLFSFVLLMPFILLSGISTPIGNMPIFFQYLTLINPLRYAIDLTHRVYLEGATLTQLIPVSVAACRHRRDHPADRIVDVPQPACLISSRRRRPTSSTAATTAGEGGAPGSNVPPSMA